MIKCRPGRGELSWVGFPKKCMLRPGFKGRWFIWGMIPGKSSVGVRAREMQEARQPGKGVYQASHCSGHLGLGGPGAPWEPAGDRPHVAMKREEAGFLSYQLPSITGVAASRDMNSVAFLGCPACWLGVISQPEQSPPSESRRSNEHALVWR